MTHPSERMPGSGAEPAGALALLTPGQERFAELMIIDPQAAFLLIREKYEAMPATETPGVKTTRIGGTPIEVEFGGTLGFEKVTLIIPMANVGMATRFLKSWEQGNGLEQEFVDSLEGGLTKDTNLRVEIEVFARYSSAHARAIVWEQGAGYKKDYILDSAATKSRLVIAQIFDLLEPRGIESADEAKPADGLILLDDDEAELARLIKEDPGRAWGRIEEILRPQYWEPGEKLVSIGNTVAILNQHPWLLKIEFNVEAAALEQVMQSCGSDGLPINIMAMLIAGINGNYDLIITADFTDLRDVRLTAKDWQTFDSAEVNPNFFAALIMRIRPQEDRQTQSVGEVPTPAAQDGTSWVSDVLSPRERSSDSPVEAASAPAVPADEKRATARELPDLRHTDPAGAFAQMREKFAEAGGESGRANIGSTQVEIDMGKTSLTLSWETDYRNLALFIDECGGEGLSSALKKALGEGINGHHRLQIKAELTDSGAVIKATSTRWNGLERVNDKSGEISPGVFVGLVDMLKPFVRFQRSNPSYVDVRPAGRDRNDKKGLGRRGRRIKGTNSY